MYEEAQKKDEYIICAAAWYRDIELGKLIESNVLPLNCDRGLVFCGYRHMQCIYTAVSVTGKRDFELGGCIQGFLTSKNRFVTRQEAARIALAAKQITDEVRALYSEDIY